MNNTIDIKNGLASFIENFLKMLVDFRIMAFEVFNCFSFESYIGIIESHSMCFYKCKKIKYLSCPSLSINKSNWSKKSILVCLKDFVII